MRGITRFRLSLGGSQSFEEDGTIAMPWLVWIPNRLLQDPADVRNLITGYFDHHLLDPEKMGFFTTQGFR